MGSFALRRPRRPCLIVTGPAFGRAGTLRRAAPARAETGGFGALRIGVEADIAPQRSARRAVRPAVDAGGAHGEDELVIARVVARADGLPAEVRIEHGAAPRNDESIVDPCAGHANANRAFKVCCPDCASSASVVVKIASAVASISNWLPPMRNCPVRSPGCRSAGGETKLQSCAVSPWISCSAWRAPSAPSFYSAGKSGVSIRCTPGAA